MARGIVEFNDGLIPTLDSNKQRQQAQFTTDYNAAVQVKDVDELARPAYPRGVFSEFPSSTPKWLGSRGERAVDFRETMARMFIQLGEKERKRFLDSVDNSKRSNGPSDAGESRILASVLAGTEKTGGKGYIDFLLQQADHPHQEKSQVVETLADNYVVYYFGQAAVPFSYAGTVLNTFEDDQAINLLRIYRDMIRGTQLARRRKLLQLRYNGMIVSGSVMNLSLGLTADPETSMSFSFQLLPKFVQLLPNPDFGVVAVKNYVSVDPFYQPKDVQPTNVTAGKPVGATPGAVLGTTAPVQGQSVEVNINGQSFIVETGQSIESEDEAANS